MTSKNEQKLTIQGEDKFTNMDIVKEINQCNSEIIIEKREKEIKDIVL
jgi:hypothetical protein